MKIALCPAVPLRRRTTPSRLRTCGIGPRVQEIRPGRALGTVPQLQVGTILSTNMCCPLNGARMVDILNSSFDYVVTNSMRRYS